MNDVGGAVAVPKEIGAAGASGAFCVAPNKVGAEFDLKSRLKLKQ